MSRITLNELHKEILNGLTEKEFLEKVDLTEEKIHSLVLNKHFVTKLSTLVSRDKISCKNILNLCIDIMNNISEEKHEDWLNYAYNYILNFSFPNAVTLDLDPKYEKGTLIYLKILRIVFTSVKENRDFNEFLDFEFLTEKELTNLKDPSEYIRFLELFDKLYIYELMRLNKEITGYNSLDHIAGVHYVAMHVGKQLDKAGIPIYLGRVSGAAAGHDIGKYGCKGEELTRVPYLHYYYTEQWFRRFNIPQIGHVAVNHSTWDLELENLPLESLVLIYADFRVKNDPRKKKSKMEIFGLDESFDIILEKLDNVDEAKEKRYKRVYAKLKDFENFMISKGIDVSLEGEYKEKEEKDSSLMSDYEVVNNFINMAISHNIDLMYKLSSDESLSLVLEAARTEKDWKNIRAYLNIFREYNTYLIPKQKMLTLNFMYELLVHKEGDIRKQAAELIGSIIAGFDDEYRKEVPKNQELEKPETDSFELWDRYLDLIINPDHKIMEKHREWIGYCLKNMVGEFFKNCDKDNINRYLEIYIENIQSNFNIEENIFFLLDSLWRLPYSYVTDVQLKIIIDFIVDIMRDNSDGNDDDYNNLVVGLDTALRIADLVDYKNRSLDPLKAFINESNHHDNVAVGFLKYKIACHLHLEDQVVDYYKTMLVKTSENLSEIFLMNLKAAVHWIMKATNIEFIKEFMTNISPMSRLHTATHLCNLVKVSAVEFVRNSAGSALLQLAPMLSYDQRNDVSVELLRGLEIEGYEFSKYIPQYLGEFMLYLPPKELDEFLDDFTDYVKTKSGRTIPLILNTISVIVENYADYMERFEEDEIIYNERLNHMLGILMCGLSNYNNSVKQEAFLYIGKTIFASDILSLEEKRNIFQLIGKKLLTLLAEKVSDDLFFFNNSASLNHIYRFISDYNFFVDKLDYKEAKKVAFFPGTFDPFSLSHKQIVKEITNLGFDVYLTIDAFSWSKLTQPRMFRRNIVNLSISDELNVYLFPDNIPVNIANNRDLNYLKELFKDKELYIVVGSDVLVNASAYKSRPTKSSIHSLNHIIFLRANSETKQEDFKKAKEAQTRIKGKVINLKLPLQLEDISSSQIREHIDENRDISNLIDPLAQQYIYDYGLYLREPQYKSLIEAKSLKIEIIDNLNENILKEIGHHIFIHTDLYKNTGEKLNSRKMKLLIIRDHANNDQIVAFSAFHYIELTQLYSEFENTKVTSFLRENAFGKIMVIDGFYFNKKVNSSNLEQIIITETLSHGLSENLTYAVYHNILTNIKSEKIYELLHLHGFKQIPSGDDSINVHSVDMSKVISLMLNMVSFLKEPFKNNPIVIDEIQKSRKRLQKSLVDLYPGSLVLSFDNEMLHHKLIGKICDINNVPTIPTRPRFLGEYMCVPFGNIMQGKVAPNTVTKSLHTEKMFYPDLRGFKVGEYPNYSTLENQIKTIKSFDRTVILVDDLLHKGYRIKAIGPLFKKEDIPVKKIVVGLLSGRGKELMEIQNSEVDSAYFIPNLRNWFNENLMYPFLGGDHIMRSDGNNLNLIRSINLILPYVAPHFIKDTDRDKIFNLSMVCLENTKNILETLEKEYQELYERNLTLSRLGEVIISPRYPDKGRQLNYKFNLKPSSFIINDIEHLLRLERIVKEE